MKVYLTNTTEDTHLSTRTHRSRKNRECCNCRQLIEKGEEYTKTVGTYDGYFFSQPWHTECHKSHVQYVKEQQRKE